MKLRGDLKAFETRIGHHFAKPELLVRAVTHASMSSANRDDNQRLEFLGDRVLGLVMAEALLALDPLVSSNAQTGAGFTAGPPVHASFWPQAREMNSTQPPT